MVQFCYVILYLGTETVSCRFLLLLVASMDMDSKLEKLGHLFQVSLNASPKKVFLASAP